MASLLHEFATLIESLTGLVIGADLMVGHIPEDRQDDLVALLQIGGLPSLPRLRGNVGEYAFQVLTRAWRRSDAEGLAKLVHDALGDLPGADLGEWEACVIEGEGVPQFTGFDERQRFLMSSTYAVRGYHKATWASY